MIISISIQAAHVICVMAKVAMVVQTPEYCPERGTVAIFRVSRNRPLASASLVTFKTPLVSFAV